MPERIHSREVVFLETGMFVKNFFLGHAVGKPAEDVHGWHRL
jgi:hypothetical protein